jgi:nondiscriminating aspartyl-tRNA synthetase
VVQASRIRGRVTSIRSLGGIAFAEVFDGEHFLKCVFENPDKLVKRGAWIEVEGRWNEDATPREFMVARCGKVLSPEAAFAGTQPFNRALERTRLDALIMRSAVHAAAHEFFLGSGFKPVSSPKLVGGWVAGQTGAFTVDFYGRPLFLTISHMIYHMIILAETFPKIYEIAPIFRAERPSSTQRLAEFTIVDLGMAESNLEDMLLVFQALVHRMVVAAQATNLKTISPPADPSFERITFDEVVARSGVGAISGHQFPSAVKRWLNANFKSFVWVLNFPQRTRPFFVKQNGNRCQDAQLWYRGVQYLAAGGERETDPQVLEQKILAEGKDPTLYEPLLNAMRLGAPNMVGIGLGLERFLASVTNALTVADFAFFPRYDGRVEP